MTTASWACVALFTFAVAARSAEDDHEFMPADGWLWLAETGEDDATSRLAEGFDGQSDFPTRDSLLEPVDGAGGFDNVAPRLLAEEGPGGLEWDPSPTYRTRYKGGADYPVSGGNAQGNNWFTRIPYAILLDNGTPTNEADDTYRVRFDANTFRVYSYLSAGTFRGRWGNRNSRLVEQGATTLYLYDTRAKQYTFQWDAGSQRFRCTRIEGLSGNRIDIDQSGNPWTVTQVAGGGIAARRWEYHLVTFAYSGTVIDKIRVHEPDGQGGWTPYREIDFTYNDDVLFAGEGLPRNSYPGDLIGIADRQVLTSSTPGNEATWLERAWGFKYYVSTDGSETGYLHQVRGVSGPQSFTACPDFHTTFWHDLPAGTIDTELEYRSDKRLVALKVNTGCSCGKGTFGFEWQDNTPQTSLYYWQTSVTIAQPDNATRLLDYNLYAQTVNEVRDVGAKDLLRFWYYSGTYGELSYLFPPPSCTTYNPTSHQMSVSLSNGARFLYSYDSYRNLSAIRRRDAGLSTEIYVSYKTFNRFPTLGTGRFRFLKVEDRAYPTASSSSGAGKVTTFVYTFRSAPEDTLSILSRATTLPAVPLSENGSNSPVTITDGFDEDGNHTRTDDNQGHVTAWEHDDTRRVVTAQVGDPGPSGLNIRTEYQYDVLGRQRKEIRPPFDAYHSGGILSGFSVESEWHTTKLSGGELVVLHHGNAGAATYADGAISISVSDRDGRTLVSALGTPTWSLAADFLEGQATLDQAFPAPILRRTTYLHVDGKLKEERVWRDAEGADLPSNWLVTTYDYDESGRRESTTNPSGTITRQEFDPLGRVTAVKVGTSDANLLVVESRTYDEDSGGDPRSPNNLGRMTTVRQFTDTTDCETSGSARVTEYDYDQRGRLAKVRSPNQNRTEHGYSNRDQLVETKAWDTSVDPEKLVSWSQSVQDVLGREYKSLTYGINASGQSTGYSSVHLWRDARGAVIKERSRGKVLRKILHDAAGRVVRETVSVDTSEGDTNYAAAGTLEQDTVLSQTHSFYDKAGGAELVSSFQRRPGQSGLGALFNPSTCQVLIPSQASYTANWYDGFHRSVVGVRYGDYGGNPLCARPTGLPPAASSWSPPGLVSKTIFDVAGQVEESVDANGVRTRLEYRDDGSLARRVENFQDGVFSSQSPTQDRITEHETFYQYDVGDVTYPKVEIVRRKNRAWNGSTYLDQETAYGYGVACGTGDDQSRISSNDLLAAIHRPDPVAGGAAGTTPEDIESFAYNLQGELIWRREPGADGLTPNGTQHVLTRSVEDRTIEDAIPLEGFGPGVDQRVRAIERQLDALGRTILVTSRGENDVVVNQVRTTYGPYGVVELLEEDNQGPIGTQTFTVDPAWSYPTDGSTAVRRTSTTYPGGTPVIGDVYSGLDDSLSRVTRRTLGYLTLFQDEYLGVGRAVKRTYGTSLVWDLSLDGFGRPGTLLVGGGNVSHYVYTHDFEGQLEFREDRKVNCYNPQFSEDYTWDALGRLSERKRGIAPTGGTTLSNISESECLARDPAGNVPEHYLGAPPCYAPILYKYNASDEIAERTLPGGQPDDDWAAYDAPGNLERLGERTDGTFYTFDAWHRLVHVQDLGFFVAAYEWNGLGQLVQRLGSGGQTLTDYVYDETGSRIVGDGHWHVHGTGGPRDYVGMGSGTSVTFFLIPDAYGDTVVSTFYNGSVYYRFDYDVGGTPRMHDSSGCANYLVWGNLVLKGGALYLKDPGLYVAGASLPDPELPGGGLISQPSWGGSNPRAGNDWIPTGADPSAPGSCGTGDSYSRLAAAKPACTGTEEQEFWIFEAFDDASTPHINDPLDEKLRYCSRKEIVNYGALFKCNQSCRSKACTRKGDVCDPEIEVPAGIPSGEPAKPKEGGEPVPARTLIRYKCKCFCAAPVAKKGRFEREREAFVKNMEDYAHKRMREELPSKKWTEKDEERAKQAAKDCMKAATELATPKGERRKA